jgi:hypothetical protein
VIASGVLPLVRLLDEAMRLARRLLRPVYPSAAVATVAGQVLVVVCQFVYTRQLEVGGCGAAVAFLGLMLVFVALTMLPYVAMGAAATAAAAGEEVSMARCWRFTVRGRTLGTLILAGLAVGLSYLCCFVPILYVAPMLAVTVPAMVAEGRVWGDALRRSAELTRFNPRRRLVGDGISRGFVVLLVTSLVSGLFSLPTQMPFQALILLRTFRDLGSEEAMAATMTDPTTLWLQVGGGVLGALAATLAGLFTSSALALLFFDLRRRREAPDLERGIAAIDGGRPAAEAAP